ncbi:pantetheine-phosphate adenylyltransferase, partial [Acinetobacter sp. 163]|nr:pantetheine-phosphate adenylyltransferase [Acinetobacter sp. 163]
MRLKWLQEATSHLGNVTCKIQKGLVVDACKQVGATTLVRGIRTTIDFEYEKNMAYMNTQIDSEID